MEALNGGMYFVKGKVEMYGDMMLAIIRSKGHSVQIDSRSTNTHVIMTGKRSDNGDVWTVEFSIDDAKRAGIYQNQWEKMPKVMCMWRCVSQLGRFLFSDLLKGCYVKGEISDAPAFDAPVDQITGVSNVIIEHAKPEILKISNEEALKLMDLFDDCSDEYKSTLLTFLKKQNVNSFYDLPKDIYERILSRVSCEREKNLASKIEVISPVVEVANESA